MVEHPPSFKSRHRNKTVVIASCVLGVIALLEVLLAGFAVAPRILATLKNSRPPHDQAASVAPVAATPAPALTQSSQSVQPQATPSDNAPSATGSNETAPANSVTQPTAPDNALESGSTLGIVNAKLEGGDEGSRKLVVTIKANPKVPIDVPQVKVQVYFYDTDGTEITPSKAQVTSSWTSPPIDWKDGDMEILEVHYLPDSTDPDIKFAGYVVAIYYKGDLQDYRAEPGQLTKLFPLKYFIGTDE